MRLEPCDSVVLTVTASAAVSDNEVIVHNVLLTPAAASCTVELYDPAFAGVTTTVGATLKVAMQGAANGATAALAGSGSGIRFLNGCIAVVAGTGARATIVHAHI